MHAAPYLGGGRSPPQPACCMHVHAARRERPAQPQPTCRRRSPPTLTLTLTLTPTLTLTLTLTLTQARTTRSTPAHLPPQKSSGEEARAWTASEGADVPGPWTVDPGPWTPWTVDSLDRGPCTRGPWPRGPWPRGRDEAARAWRASDARPMVRTCLDPGSGGEERDCGTLRAHERGRL